MFTRPAMRALAAPSLRAAARRPAVSSIACVAQRAASTHAISNPTLADIEKRWESLPPQEQADLWMALRDRMKSNWSELTLQEKKAAYWIAFGAHGPRATRPEGENKQVFLWTIGAVASTFILWGALKAFARPAPHTMTKEYQEQTNEYLKEQKFEPIRAEWSMVQSKPESK